MLKVKIWEAWLSLGLSLECMLYTLYYFNLPQYGLVSI